ncbi:hypothetical protein F4604DRAFT_928148 [Suillus subluteus]|nr:hypothetical protein F4604DRAFT_928148 [Suillus subluteus]
MSLCSFARLPALPPPSQPRHSRCTPPCMVHLQVGLHLPVLFPTSDGSRQFPTTCLYCINFSCLVISILSLVSLAVSTCTRPLPFPGTSIAHHSVPVGLIMLNNVYHWLSGRLRTCIPPTAKCTRSWLSADAYSAMLQQWRIFPCLPSPYPAYHISVICCTSSSRIIRFSHLHLL